MANKRSLPSWLRSSRAICRSSAMCSSRSAIVWREFFFDPIGFSATRTVAKIESCSRASQLCGEFVRFPMRGAFSFLLPFAFSFLAVGALQQGLLAQAIQRTTPADARTELSEALSAEEWRRVDRAIERALAWLITQQNPDGSFPTRQQGQPAVTSLCVMAFFSAGHQPGVGEYGERLNRAIDFVLE